MYWFWFGCLCLVTLRGALAHWILWADLDTRNRIPGFALISGVIADFIVPLAIVAAALAFRPVPFNPC